MKTITCNCGKEIKVDDEAFALLNRHKWNCRSKDSVYHTSMDKPITHFIIAVPVGLIVDHINHDGHDNRIANLRLATQQQNCWNSVVKRNSLTGVKGITFDASREKYLVRVRFNGVRKNLGRFETLEEATKVYNEAAKLAYGEFAVLNPLHQPTDSLQ